MKKYFLTLLIFTAIQNVFAQEYYKKTEYGIGAGISQYYGDLNPFQNINFMGYSGSLFLKKNFNPYISVKIAGTYALVGASDKNNNNAFEKARNLSFKSNVAELAIQSEFNFLQFNIEDFENRFTPYISLGVGGFYYNPYATLGGKKYYLQPLGTEGQNYAQYSSRKYTNYALCLPVGFGIKYWVAKGITFGLEIVDRFTSTDYLDDVSTTYVGANLFPSGPLPYAAPSLQLQDRSNENGGTTLGIAGRQRGVSSNKDQYLSAQATISIRLKTYKCPGN